MTTILALLLTAAAWQQPQAPARRGAEPVTRSPANLAPSPNGFVAPQEPPPRTAYDTTIGAVAAIGRAVAEVKAELDRFRMLSRNESGGEMVESGATLRTRCQELATASQLGRRTMCRSCARRNVQAALDQYRVFLPSLAQLGTRCATTLQRLRGTDPVAGTANLRREARNISDFVVAGLRQYEARLSPVLQALSGTTPRGGG